MFLRLDKDRAVVKRGSYRLDNELAVYQCEERLSQDTCGLVYHALESPNPQTGAEEMLNTCGRSFRVVMKIPSHVVHGWKMYGIDLDVERVYKDTDETFIHAANTNLHDDMNELA